MTPRRSPRLTSAALAVLLFEGCAVGLGIGDGHDGPDAGIRFGEAGPPPTAFESDAGERGGAAALAAPAHCREDGVLEGDEECDGEALSGRTCASATLGASPDGVLRCVHCVLDVSGCHAAGPGVSGAGGGIAGLGAGGHLGG